MIHIDSHSTRTTRDKDTTLTSCERTHSPVWGTCVSGLTRAWTRHGRRVGLAPYSCRCGQRPSATPVCQQTSASCWWWRRLTGRVFSVGHTRHTVDIWYRGQGSITFNTLRVVVVFSVGSTSLANMWCCTSELYDWDLSNVLAMVCINTFRDGCVHTIEQSLNIVYYYLIIR